MGKRAIACASSSLGIPFFRSKSAKLLYHNFAVLPGYADASAHSIEVPTQLDAMSVYALESTFEPFCFVQFTFKGEDTLCSEEG